MGESVLTVWGSQWTHPPCRVDAEILQTRDFGDELATGTVLGLDLDGVQITLENRLLCLRTSRPVRTLDAHLRRSVPGTTHTHAHAQT